MLQVYSWFFSNLLALFTSENNKMILFYFYYKMTLHSLFYRSFDFNKDWITIVMISLWNCNWIIWIRYGWFLPNESTIYLTLKHLIGKTIFYVYMFICKYFLKNDCFKNFRPYCRWFLKNRHACFELSHSIESSLRSLSTL